MTEYPKVTESGIIGNQAEALAESKLASIAVVNRLNKDVGLDFHCFETLPTEDVAKFLIPGNAFYGQSKGHKELDGTKFYIRRETVNLWLKLESPVYVFISDLEHQEVYWISIESLRSDIDSQLKTQAVNCSISIDLNKRLSPEGIREFRAQLARDRESRFKKDQPLPPYRPLGNGYFQAMVPPLKDEKDIQICRDDIRFAGAAACVALVLRYLERHEPVALQEAKLFSDAAWSVDKNHWEVPYWRGLVFFLQDSKLDAIQMVEESLAIMRRDQTWMANENGKRIFSHVEILRNKLANPSQGA